MNASRLLFAALVVAAVSTAACRCLGEPVTDATGRPHIERDGTFLTVAEKGAQDVSIPLTAVTGNPMWGLLLVAGARALFSGRR